MDSTSRVQQSIRSFFQPRVPSYTAPPGVPTAFSAPAPRTDSDGISNNDSQEAPIISNQPPSETPPQEPNIPERASISTIQEIHVQPIRRINSLLLPVNYPDSFYHQILDPNPLATFSRVILWSDPEPKVIGAIVCRLDLTPDTATTPPTFDIYIQSLALLSPYRSKGLAASLLTTIISSAASQSNITIDSIYAHVWTENTEALKWYLARGFKREEPLVQGYYRRLKPDTAWIFRRRINPSDHLQNIISQIPSPAVTSSIQPTTSKPSPVPTARPSVVHTASFQDRRPDREWNDLPEDVLGSSLLKTPSLSSVAGSAASSRSSSRGAEVKGKKKRQYPAAAFGIPGS
ncbi:hypothetical protein B7494_g6126 [Chlorociboria aeruginascens]|nr:hypothetical protein B7494_g6126 [Chlorociboria aeruginascens]